MFPRVSLLVAMRNEASHIEACVSSLLSQDYPSDKLEILVIDGCSDDNSAAIVGKFSEGHPNVRIIQNPLKTQSAGWNLGIAESAGEVVGIVSGHSELAPDYVSRAVNTLQRTGADLVGGPMRARGSTRVARAVALATSTPFGVGGARFHYAENEEDVDTVYMGLCWRRSYERIGGFDGSMVRDQDDEWSYRLRKSGGRIVCNPEIRSTYYNRASIASLWKQYFQYGYWKVKVMKKHPRQMQLRHFIPSIFLLTVVALSGIATVSTRARIGLLCVLGAYLLGHAWAVGTALRKGAGSLVFLLPVVFLCLHLSYGLGFAIGCAHFPHWWSTSITRGPIAPSS